MSAARRDWTLSPEALGRFLMRLDDDVATAGRKYELLRKKLIRLFEWRGCVFAEDLADETINRVIRRLEGGVDLGPDEVPRYSSGVACRVYLEHLREVRRSRPHLDDAGRAPWVPGRHETTDLRLACLERGLGELGPVERDLILRYYGPDRIRGRRELASELGVAAGNLRIRAYRIRAKLERWIAGEIEAEGGA
ncbi:MAG: hypothetical protein AAF560_22120 [Acidobacteriota bacterium]